MSPITRRRSWLIPAALVIVFAGLAVRAAPLPFEAAAVSLRGYDADLFALIARSDLHALRRGAWLLLAFASAALALGLFFWARTSAPDTAKLEERRRKLFNFFIGFGTAVTLFLVLWRAGFEAPWYPLTQIIENPASIPIFGHRLLLVWAGEFLHSAPLHLAPRASFFVVQAVAIAAATFMTIRWSALFAGRSLAWMGGPLLLLFLAPTFQYFTYYDIAVVFFYSLGLWALHEQRWGWFLFAVAAGTLNHEIILLLIPAGVIGLWGRVPRRTSLTVGAIALAIHFLLRAATQMLLPMPSLFSLHIWTNAVLMEQMRRNTIECLLVLFFSWGCGAIALRAADSFLKRVAIALFFLTLLVTFLFGRFNEARQFEALIPVLIALVLRFALPGREAQSAGGATPVKLQ